LSYRRRSRSSRFHHSGALSCYCAGSCSRGQELSRIQQSEERGVSGPMHQLCVFGDSMRVHVRDMEQLINNAWVFIGFQDNSRFDVVNSKRVFVHGHHSVFMAASSPEWQPFHQVMACYSQDTLQCVAAEVAGEIWPAGWGCSRGVAGIGVLYLVASPTQRFLDYEVLYRPAGTQAIFGLGLPLVAMAYPRLTLRCTPYKVILAMILCGYLRNSLTMPSTFCGGRSSQPGTSSP